MCNACGFMCCAMDCFDGCGCESCDNPECWEYCPDCDQPIGECLCDSGDYDCVEDEAP
jgi:hypothetical protein